MTRSTLSRAIHAILNMKPSRRPHAVESLAESLRAPQAEPMLRKVDEVKEVDKRLTNEPALKRRDLPLWNTITIEADANKSN